MNEILTKSKSAVISMALVFTLVLMLCLVLLTYDAVKISDLSDFTIIMSNFLIPFLLFTIVLILSIAVYVLKEASEVFKKEFSDATQNKSTESCLENLKYQISILNADIAHFTVILERGSGKTDIDEGDKSCHYNGVQGLCCFLSGYYADEVNSKKNIIDTASVAKQSNYLLAASILTHFLYLHNILLTKDNDSEELKRTKELLDYFYHSKLEYAVKIITESGRTGNLEEIAQMIKVIYS